MMYWYGDHMSGWGYGLGILTMVLFWGLLTVAVIAAVRYLARAGRQETPVAHHEAEPSQAPDPEEVLAERFARGEIDADEYRQRLAILRERMHPAAAP